MRACLFLGCWLSMLASYASAIEWNSHPVNQWVKQSPREGQPATPLKYEGSGAIDSRDSFHACGRKRHHAPLGRPDRSARSGR
jgi:hypothetical protein